ncbi:Cha4p KNAG_0G02130 [Huiozyma naganishii CBS 8797]|uniref:Zn(2)-C6 fungal-type domain-containing protein n=1 Tax=Huiozyma naganishii (strain ATCC MYA-139 / BCRC 22969 / CBS 8797 / KCTC 17520 / NBRC 10181 / NCYC 3082 / Yp74L-3) TaxID=1071383 RepID=J7R8S3_HUIN7|nr:hypothetical protein KNAG_0G02130 [Kazachstania naganishii CBS 8797]CCK71270.1 hypothetical protein KNAG_0G02130 [Kazachstania naganishii CBS 8797]
MSVMKEDQVVLQTVKPKRLACLHCRHKRKKCNMKSPCSNCQRAGMKCIFTHEDLRSKRKSVSYLTTLEEHIATLESSIVKAREAPTEAERVDALRLISLFEDSKENSATGMSPLSYETSRDVTPSNLILSQNHVAAPKVHTLETNSIYPTNSLSIKAQRNHATNEARIQAQATIRNLARSPPILRSLSIFFKWLYPGHYMFIHRETFLSAFFGDESTKDYYCSEELVFAISALGAKAAMVTDELHEKSEVYYHRAKQIVLTKVFQLVDRSLAESTSSSKLAIIQTLLCLAFYDVASAENSMAWYLSGLAFRIAHEIGLHLSPEAWNHVYEDELSKMDFAVRSRIYWGCYLADHLISVLFGRSTSLRMSNSTVPETFELPDIETGIEDYIFNPGVPLSMANPLKKLIVLSRVSEIFATKIFIQTETIERRSGHLIKFNTEMTNWRQSLPKGIKWNKKTLKELDKFDPTTMYVWLHFYIVLISYNKPFIFELDQSKNIIELFIEELFYVISLWRNNFGDFQRCGLYMIYSGILAIQCMNTGAVSKDYYDFFIDFLESDSVTYEVAKNFIENNRSNDDSKSSADLTDFNDLLGFLSHGNDFTLEYNFDLTLLNEIDNLVNADKKSVSSDPSPDPS